MIKYIGSKRTLIPQIVDIVQRLRDVRTVCDLFTGTTRVARGLKANGYWVLANDIATYSEVLATAYVEQDADRVNVETLREKLRYLESLPGVEGFFTETYCRKSRYFQPHNGQRIDAIRPAIDRTAENRYEWATLLVSLMEAADRVDSTTGLQMAYLKSWAPRSFNPLELRVPRLLPGEGRSERTDANLLAPTLADLDLCYVDPPYNQHSYFSNYHIWETLVRNDTPAVYGTACKRVDCKTVKTDYNSKRRAWSAFADVITKIPTRYLLVSFNNEGFFDLEQISSLLLQRGEEVACLPVDYKRYVGAQIGIYNPKGEKVGAVSHLRNKEYIFLSGPHAAKALVGLRPRAVTEQLTLEALG